MSSGSWQNLSVKTYLSWFWRRNCTASITELTEIVSPPYIYCVIKILFFSFLEKLLSLCSMEALQSSKYCKKTFLSHENRGSSMEVNGIGDGLHWNSWGWMSLMFIISKIVSISMQNLAVPEASGGSYWASILETVELRTCAAYLTFIIEYVVNFIWSNVNFGKICNPIDLSS